MISPKSKTAQRLGGVVMMILGAVITYLAWHQAFTEGSYNSLSCVGPAFCVIGLMPLFYPMNQEEWVAKHSLPPFERFSTYKLGQKVILGLALLTAAVNWAFISGTVPLP